MPDYGDDKGFSGSGGGEAATGGGDKGPSTGGSGGGQDRSGMKETLDKYREEKGGVDKGPTDKGPTDRQKAFGTKAVKTALDPKSTKTTTGTKPKTDRQNLASSAAAALAPKTKAEINPVFDEDGTIQGIPDPEYDPSEASVVGPLSKSEFEKVMEITDVDPFGKGSSSTAIGRGMKRGIASLADFLGALTGKKVSLTTSYPDMSQTKKNFIQNQQYEKYLDPFGQGKVLTTMKNYNLTDEEQAAYDAAAKAQGTDKPMQVMTEQEYAQDLADRGVDIDPSKYAPKANTIRSGLRPGDLTQFGPVQSRPRDIGLTEMGIRGAFATTPLGLPLGILSAVTDIDRVKGIAGFPDPVTGQPFQPAPDKSLFQRGIDIFTGGVGTTALSQANQAAQNLLSGQGIFNTTTAQSLPSVTDNVVPGYFPAFEQRPTADIGKVDIGIGSDTKITDLTKPSFLDYFSSPQSGGGGGGGDGPVILPTDIEPEEVQDDTNMTQPMNNLFAQEIYGGLQGPFVVPSPNFGISALPTNRTNRPARFTV